MLSTLTAPLERLNALVVVVLSTEQRAQWPTALVNRFDHDDVIHPLDIARSKNCVRLELLVRRKYRGKCLSKHWSMFSKNIRVSFKVMRLMRDMVDEERANPREMKYDEPNLEIAQLFSKKNNLPGR